MKFGAMPLADADGAILAHTIRAGGVVLKKGRRLGRDDLALLAQAGARDVVAARLDPDDVGEDDAAAALARAVAGPGVRVAVAKTGRANLFAETPGLFIVDGAAVHAVNAVDEALTLATLAPDSVVHEGDMIATVKVIPFAVPSAVVAAVVAAARARAHPHAHATPAHATEVRPFRALRTSLVLTRLDGQPEVRLDQAARAVTARVHALGGTVVDEARVAHDVDALAAALASRVHDVDLALVLGASAIVDRRDVVPAAFERIGGTIDHFGMPVDPGNLILVARLGARTALIGVPSCARSPKRSGFDMVLERAAAGLPIGRREIMAMGVGGLLPDIAARPGARDGNEARLPGKIGGIVLAAGSSRRMGATNKLLAPIDGKPMVAHAVATLAAEVDGPLVVVTGHEADLVAAAVGATGIAARIVHNADHASGLASSLKVGVAALAAEVDAVVVALGDMPRVRGATIAALVSALAPDEGAAICAPTFEGKRGNPVVWARRFFAEMQALGGDVGAKELLARHADALALVAVDDPGVLQDIDTAEALRALTGESVQKT